MSSDEKLVNCRLCGHVVSTFAKFCPNCGSPNVKSSSSLPRDSIQLDIEFSYPSKILNDFYLLYRNESRTAKRGDYYTNSKNYPINPPFECMFGGRIGIDINRNECQISNPLYIHQTNDKYPNNSLFPCYNADFLNDKIIEQFRKNIKDYRIRVPNRIKNLDPATSGSGHCRGWTPIISQHSTLSFVRDELSSDPLSITIAVESTFTKWFEDSERGVNVYIIGGKKHQQLSRDVKRICIKISAQQMPGENDISIYENKGWCSIRKKMEEEFITYVPMYNYEIKSIVGSNY